MKAKAYLLRYHDIKLDVDALRERQRFYLDLATACTAAYGAMPGGGGGNEGRVSRNMDKAVDMARKLEERMGELIAEENEIESVIAELEDDTMRRILTLRYINGWSLKTVANRMGYSEDYMRHLHGDALAQIVVPEKYST